MNELLESVSKHNLKSINEETEGQARSYLRDFLTNKCFINEKVVDNTYLNVTTIDIMNLFDIGNIFAIGVTKFDNKFKLYAMYHKDKKLDREIKSPYQMINFLIEVQKAEEKRERLEHTRQSYTCTKT